MDGDRDRGPDDSDRGHGKSDRGHRDKRRHEGTHDDHDDRRKKSHTTGRPDFYRSRDSGRSHHDDFHGRHGPEESSSPRHSSGQSRAAPETAGPSGVTYSPRGRGSHHQSGIQQRFQNLASASSSAPDTSPVPSQPGGSSTRGRGRGGGLRGTRIPVESRIAQSQDFVPTKAVDKSKKANLNDPKIKLEPIQLVANYFPLMSRHKWNLYNYHVDFVPEVESTREKRLVFQQTCQTCMTSAAGWYLFSGSALYTSSLLPPDMLKFPVPGGALTIQIKSPPSIIGPSEDINIQVYNIIMRKCLQEMKLDQIGRYFYDPKNKFQPDDFKAERIEIFPGFKTSFRQHEHQLLLCVDITNKVIHTESVLDVMKSLDWNPKAIQLELIGSIFTTTYNYKTYRIDDIKFDESPSKLFDFKGRGQMTLIDYYEGRHKKRIKDVNQPLIYYRPKRREIRRGMPEVVACIPELCQVTGFRDRHRDNPFLMKKLSSHLQIAPKQRLDKIKGFRSSLTECKVTEKVLQPAGLTLGEELVRFQGHVLPAQTIVLARSKVQLGLGSFSSGEKYDWSGDMRGSPMSSTVDLKTWAVVMPTGKPIVAQLLEKLIQISNRMGFKIYQPLDKLQAAGSGSNQVFSYMDSIDKAMTRGRDNVQLIFCVLLGGEETLYAAVKRKCFLDYGVPSQCVKLRNFEGPRGVDSKVTKLAIQMNAKIGGVPWKLEDVPLKTMVLGFNISTVGQTKSSKVGQSTAALVASINQDFTKYFSCVVEQDAGQNLSPLLGTKLIQALDAYERTNGALPQRIIFYRDGVGEGQLKAVTDLEVEALNEAIKTKYEDRNPPRPKFIFVVVTKRLNTKFFKPSGGARGDYGNPSPGTVVDDVVTLPERKDFYLIPSKGTGQGTISPVAFNSIYDDWNIAPIRMQLLTYKLCHLYFNWSSTVNIPAPCQYAQKLAYLANMMKKTGQGLDGVEPDQKLSSSLYYL